MIWKFNMGLRKRLDEMRNQHRTVTFFYKKLLREFHFSEIIGLRKKMDLYRKALELWNKKNQSKI